MEEQFVSKYGATSQGIAKWMKTFYTDPMGASKFLPTVLQHMALLPASEQLLSGAPSLSTAWFLAKAFKVLPVEERVQIFYDLASHAQSQPQAPTPTTEAAAAESEHVCDGQHTHSHNKNHSHDHGQQQQQQGQQQQQQQSAPDVDGQLDTVLRSFYLMNEPEMDAFLESHVSTCLADLRASGMFSAPEEKGQLEFNEKCIQSMLPPAGQREREEIWSWPIPAFAPEEFEQAVLHSEYPLFACTRTTFIDTQRLRVLHEHYPPEYDRALPLVVSQLTGAINDSLWSVFFASGHKPCIYRLLDIASVSFQRYFDLRAQGGVSQAQEAAAAAAAAAAGQGEKKRKGKGRGKNVETGESDGKSEDVAAKTAANNTPTPAPPPGPATEQESIQELLALMQSSAQHDVRGVVQRLPTRNPSAIVAIMAGLSASWSLVENGRAHTSIATILSTTLAQLTGRSLSGSLTQEESRVLNVLQIIVEAIRETNPSGGGCS